MRRRSKFQREVDAVVEEWEAEQAAAAEEAPEADPGTARVVELSTRPRLAWQAAS